MSNNASEHSSGKMIAIILSLAWPTMLEELLHTAVQYIDTAMVGSLGTEATAAVGATTTINWLINGSISALGIGFLAFIAKAYGAKNEELAKQAVAQAVLVVLGVGIASTIVTVSLSTFIPVWMQVKPAIRELASRYFFVLYLPMLPRTASLIFGSVLRASGDTKTPMRAGLIANVVNVGLNVVFIYKLGLGVVGAAIASAIAFTIGGMIITVAVWKHPVLSPRGERLSPNREILKPCMKVAVPNMLQRFGTSFGYVAFASMINSLGEVSMAAHTIANTVESAFYIPGYGMQAAAATLAGNAYGAKDERGMKSLAKMFLPLEVGLMMISGGLLFLLAPNLVGIFSKSDEVIRLGTTVLRMVAVTEPFYGFSIIVEGFLMGVGKTKIPFIYNIFGMWGVRIIGTFLCTQVLEMGLVSAWTCMIAHNLLLFVLFLVCYLRGTWNPLRQRRNV